MNTTTVNRKTGYSLNTTQRARTIAVLLLSASLLTACAGSKRAGSTARNPNLITRAEIEDARQSGVRDLYELIDRLRPSWLQTRSQRSLALETLIAVYQNETRMGGVDILRSYRLDAVSSLRYLDAAQAMLLPGIGSAHVEGAIIITTAAGGPRTQ